MRALFAWAFPGTAGALSDMHRRRLIALTALPLLQPGRAEALEASTGRVLLAIGGQVRNTNRGTQALFDMPMLERLPQTSINARTPWYPSLRKFTGPLLRDLLQMVDAQGLNLRASALNDYRVDIPVADAQRWDVIVARLLDDQPMTVRDKGPLFIMYPFDTHPELRSPVYFTRCAWQLTSIEVR